MWRRLVEAKKAEWVEYRTQVSAYERDRMLPVL
jgi:glutamine synthetase